MKKQFVSVIAAASLMLVLGASAFADIAISSITGGVEASGETEGSINIITTTETITNDEGEPIGLDEVKEPVIKVTTVAQASDANQSVGMGVSDNTITKTSLTVGQNSALIAEYEKTKDAQTTKEALDAIGATSAVEQAVGISAEKVDDYAEVQILDISFNEPAKAAAQGSGGVTMTMRVAGIDAESSGFITYYDENGNPQAVPFTVIVDENGNALIRFKLPNPSIVRIFTTKNL
ncbi:MAG: hypothetical protein ACI4JC_02145 [Faecalibacterium sp.]